MAWDPNEKGSWAWLTKEASEHGGVLSYIDDIEENAKNEAHTQDLKWLPFILAAGATLGTLGKIAYDKIAHKIAHDKELKQKSIVAKEKLVDGVKQVEQNYDTEKTEEDEENE